MPRLLILTPYYAPLFHPRAHRWTALAAFWAACGHEVHVVCARQRGYPGDALWEGVYVHRVGFDSLRELVYSGLGSRRGRGRVGAGAVAPGRGLRLLAWLYKALWKRVYFPDDACLWYWPARQKALELLAMQPFDGLITVSFPFTSHLVGLALKRHYPHLPWLADTGDPFSITAVPRPNAWLYGRLNQRLERRVLEKSDVVVVTHALAARAYQRYFGPSAHAVAVVPPLLHPPPEQAPVPLPAADKAVLRIGYFGAMYAPVRTPTAVLALLETTLQRRPDWAGRLEVHFFGEIFPEFWTPLRRCPLVCVHGLRPRAEVRAAMQEMDILLHLGNKTNYQLPSKVVEYLAAGKPVVHLSYVADDPFVEVFGQGKGLLRLDVQDERVGEAGIARWLAWLDDAGRGEGMAVAPERLQPFLVESVAAAYWTLLGIGR